MRAAILLALGIGSLAATTGCAPPPLPTRVPSAHPEAVAVDFFAKNQSSVACSGTLLAPDVVLTAAHCTEGSTSARVTAPDAHGQTSTVQSIRVLDWQVANANADNRQHHDLALLILRQPIAIGTYAKIEKDYCGGCVVTHVTRTSTRQGAKIAVAESAPMRLSSSPSETRPFTLTVTTKTRGSGGALIRKDANGNPFVVGVMSGLGENSGAGYIAITATDVAETWIHDVVAAANAARNASSSSTLKPRTLRPLDDQSSADNASSSDATGSTDGNGASSESPPPDSASPSVTDAPGGGDQQPGTDPVNAPDPIQTSGANDVGTDDGTMPPDAPPDEPLKRETPQDGAAGDTTGGETTSDPSAEGTSGDQQGVPADTTAPAEYANPAIRDAGPSGGQPITTEGNGTVVYTNFDPNDPVLSNTQDYAKSVDGVANVIGVHGVPGGMEGAPDQDTLDAMAANHKPIVLASCFGGSDDPMGEGSNASQIWHQTGSKDPQSIYGCDGYVFYGNECSGNWKNALGEDANPPPELKLKNCDYKVTCAPQPTGPCKMVGTRLGCGD